MVINKMKKDMLILEQKLIQLTRQRRPSSYSRTSEMKLPMMAPNLLYDMSSSSPSSSDSDSSSDTYAEWTSSQGYCSNDALDMTGASGDGHIKQVWPVSIRWH